MAAKSYQMDLTTGPIFKKVIIFTLPLMASGFLQLFYNAADMIVVGQFAGNTSLAAVGATGSLINLIVNAFIAFSTGASVIVAQAIGANQSKKIHEIVHTSIALGVITGFLVMFFGIISCKSLLILTSAPANVLDKATLYMRVYFCGMPGFMLYNFGAAILRSAGDTKRPLYILSASGIANVLLNLLFVIVFNMDVLGVALATIISQYISAVWVTVVLIKEKADYRLVVKKLRIYKNQLSRIIILGIPMGIQSSFFSISNVIIQSAVNSFGTAVVAGNTAAANIEGFVYTGASTFAQAAITFSGQNTGARKFDRVKKTLIVCTSLALGVGILLGGISLIFSRPLLSIYTESADSIAAGTLRMGIICMFYGFCGVMDSTAFVTRGMGKTIVPMFITLACVCVMRAICVFTIFDAYGYLEIVYWSYPVTWILAIIGQMAYFVYIYKKNTKFSLSQ